MDSSGSRSRLGDSWVVEGEDSMSEDQIREKDGDYVPSSQSQENALPLEPSPKQSHPRRTKNSPSPALDKPREPSHPPIQLKMPTLSNSLDGSWDEPAPSKPRPTRPSPLRKQQAAPARARQLEPEREVRRRTARHVNTTSSSSSPDSDTPRRHVKFGSHRQPYPAQDILATMASQATNVLSFSLDVIIRALRILKTPLSYMLAVYLLFGLGVVVRNLITTSIFASLSPICRIPGTSLLNLPFCPGNDNNRKWGGDENVPNVEFDQLMTVQSQFEEVLEESAGTVGLPMDMKRGEAGIRDLRQLVKYSHVNSKNELLLEFDGFIDTARIASYDLQKFNSHIGRAVDSLLSTTRWTSRILLSISSQPQRSPLAYLLSPFTPSTALSTERALLDQYTTHVALIEEELFKLISEAQALLLVLANLEDRLEIIHGIATRDGIHANSQRDEVLAELWTMLGGNKQKLAKVDKSLFLLRQVSVYRKNAYAHVAGTVVRLQGIAAGIEDLRERVAIAGVVGERVPLAVQIENVKRGVERLEEGRGEARRREDEIVRKAIDGGEIIIGGGEDRTIQG